MSLIKTLTLFILYIARKTIFIYVGVIFITLGAMYIYERIHNYYFSQNLPNYFYLNNIIFENFTIYDRGRYEILDAGKRVVPPDVTVVTDYGDAVYGSREEGAQKKDIYFFYSRNDRALKEFQTREELNSYLQEMKLPPFDRRRYWFLYDDSIMGYGLNAEAEEANKWASEYLRININLATPIEITEQMINDANIGGVPYPITDAWEIEVSGDVKL